MRTREQDDSVSVSETVVGASLKVEGDLKSQGDIRIDGEVKGSISTDGSVLVGTGAKVTASISSQSAEIAGVVDGDIKAAKRIALTETARVTGNISCSELVIAQGARFSGQSSMEQSSATVDVPSSMGVTSDVAA